LTAARRRRDPEAKMGKQGWARFPHDQKAFDHAGAKLAKAWPRLHAGDCEPFPDPARIAAVLAAHPGLGKPADAESLAVALQQAWRDYHRGDFQAAHDAGVKLGPLGASVAIKAGGIHAVYLVDDDDARLARFEQLGQLAEAAIRAMPDDINAHYRRAFVLGRYSQGISVAKALSMGLAGKVKESLDRTLKLAPAHAEAHTALGLYHAEIINKVGAMIGGLTYGAKAASCEQHLKKALELTPDSPIAHIEYGNGLILLHGDKREDDAAAAYEKAAGLKPKDAMEQLDVAYARSQLED
jgi:tetratricopeptide (TPR) repeat protein